MTARSAKEAPFFLLNGNNQRAKSKKVVTFLVNTEKVDNFVSQNP